MDALDYLQKLIRFDSSSFRSNLPISDYLETVLEGMGFATERIEYDDPSGVRKANIIGKKGDGIGGMAYFGHTDVVPADCWTVDDHGPFDPVVQSDRLYGRGSCDMKGSIACMLAAAGRFAAATLKAPLYVTCTADEEVGYWGAEEVARRSEFFEEMVAGQSRGIIGEPTQLEVVYAHKGTYGLVATAHGRAAHSSTREGVNANLAMIPYLAEMKSIHDETETDPAWQSDDFDPPTIRWNIGINDHATAVNVTAPQSVCTVYFRPMPGQDPETLVARARSTAKTLGLDFEVRAESPPLYVDPKSSFVQEVLRLAGKTTPHTVSYGTDGTMFTALENLVVFGPGNIAQAHTTDEWIALDELQRGTEVFTKLIRCWCGD